LQVVGCGCARLTVLQDVQIKYLALHEPKTGANALKKMREGGA